MSKIRKETLETVQRHLDLTLTIENRNKQAITILERLKSLCSKVIG